MQYLGGKSRLAKEIAAAIKPRGVWWDPFCGGLSVAVQLSIYGQGVVSDSCEPLISLYRAVRAGWIPPDSLTLAEYEHARTLADSNPLKAYAGFGCSFGGKWFGGYQGRYRVVSRTHPNGMIQDKPRATKLSLLRDVRRLTDRRCPIVLLDFLRVRPGSLPVKTVYCDPPYAGTTSYSAVREFDANLFWRRCEQWSRYADVFVSELSCPLPSEVIWSKNYEKRVGAMGQENGAKTEKLFLIKQRRSKQ